VIVLDTHTWLWYATESEKLSKQAKARIKRAETLGVHPISCLDPADRLIVGTALEMGVPVVTRDQRITEWGHVNTIW
jgi:PIN domain nuclease of toxin-antitoxin system